MTTPISWKFTPIAAVCLLGLGCVHVSEQEIHHAKVVKKWSAQASELGAAHPEVVFENGAAESPVIRGWLGATQHCNVAFYEESENTTEIKRSVYGDPVLMTVAGAIIAGSGVAVLATAHDSSAAVTGGSGISLRDKHLIVGGALAGIGALALGYTGVQLFRSRDSTQRQPNTVAHVTKDSICAFYPMSATRFQLTNGELGWGTPIDFATSDATGAFAVDIRSIPGFTFPISISSNPRLKFSFGAVPIGDLNLGHWVVDAAEKIESCADEKSCRGVAQGLTTSSNATSYRGLIDKALARADQLQFIGAIGPDVLRCFHPSQGFLSASLDATKMKDSHQVLTSTINMRGMLGSYNMQVDIELDSEAGRLRVVPVKGTTIFPAKPDCELRQWTAVDDTREAADKASFEFRRDVTHVLSEGLTRLRAGNTAESEVHDFECSGGCYAVFVVSKYAMTTHGKVRARTVGHAEREYRKVMDGLECEGWSSKSPVTCKLSSP